jgi:hypothetical protein
VRLVVAESDRATVGFDDCCRDGESESTSSCSTRPGGIGTAEAVEESVQLIIGHSRAGVCDDDLGIRPSLTTVLNPSSGCIESGVDR